MSADLFSTAFLFLAIATAGGALAFLAAQRASGRTPPEVTRCYEEALLLESLAKDLRALAEGAPAERAELESALSAVDEAAVSLRRAADMLV